MSEKDFRDDAFRALVDHSLQGVGIFVGGRLVLGNQPLAEMLDMSLDHLYSLERRQVLEIVHPEDRRRLVENMSNHLEGRPAPTRQDYRIVREDGTTRHLDTLVEVITWKGEPALQVAYWDVTETLQAQEAYRSLVEHSLQGFAIIQDGRVVYANSVVCEIAGITREQIYTLSNEQVRQLVPIERREETSSTLLGHLAGQPIPHVHETRVMRPDGTVRRVETIIQRVEYKGMPALQIACRDVTEERAAAEAYRLLRETSLQGVSIIKDGRTVYSNPAALAIAGRTAEEIYAASPEEVLEMVHPDDRGYIVENLPGVLSGEFRDMRQVYRIVHRDGGVVWLDTLAEIVEWEGGPALQVVMTDITEAKRAEEALREERDRAQMYLDVAGVMILVLDEQARVMLINRKGCEILGLIEEEVLGRSWIDTFIPERLRAEVRRVFEGVVAGELEATGRFENPIVAAGGSERMISWTNTILRDDEGRVIGTLSSGEDITERRRSEEERARLQAQLQQAQKLEAIGTLAGGVAHEINNPVNITMNFARLIKDRAEEGSQIADFAQEIIDEGERMSSIVRKLLSFARQEKERHSPARMLDIVESTVALMRMVMRKDQIRLEVDVPEDLPRLLCRSQQIQQVLMNLLTNARDALNEKYPGAHEDKVVRIVARSIERSGEEWIRTTVEDRGTGIQIGALDKVFDPFFTTKSRDQGTGLGLSVSYGIVREHRGELWVESDPGAGTRFHMDLRVDNGWKLAPEAGG